MITTRRAPRTQRLLIGAFALSILIHLFGGALWAHTRQFIARVMQRSPEQHKREQEIATSDAIVLERRAVPRRAVRSRTRPAPPHVLRREQPPATTVAVMPQRAVEEPATRAGKPSPTTPPEIAHEVHREPRGRERSVAGTASGGVQPRTAATTQLSAARLAQLNAQFAQTITASHVDLATIQKQLEAHPAAIKRVPLQFTGMQATLARGEGYIEPITMGQRIGTTVWYYTHYTYMWPDGHLEDDDIPWPFRYPVDHDLFAMHIHLIPLQLPPPGFHLTRPLKPFLAHYLKHAGQG